MGFRDDGDALLARVEALEREKALLEEQLAKERADDAELEVERAALAEARREDKKREEALRRKNKALEDELRRERGPGRLKRLVSRIETWKRTGTVPADRPTWASTYAAAVRAAWPLYACMLPLFTIPAIVRGSWHVWIAVIFAVGAPVLALLTTALPWWLGRRRLATAAGFVGLAIGVLGVVLLDVSLFAMWYARAFKGAVIFVPLLYAVIGLLHFTRAVRFGDVHWLPLPFLAFVFVPIPPLHLFIAVFGPMWSWELGGRFVDPSYGFARD